MRASDKKNNMEKANKLAESLYIQRNNEGYDYAAAEREHNDKQDYEETLKDSDESDSDESE